MGSGYPKSNEDYQKMFQILTIDGWTKLGAAWNDIDARFKKIIEITTAG